VLSPAAALLLPALAGAALLTQPIDGAFGLEFGRPVDPADLGATLAKPAAPLPPANVDQTLPEPVPGEHDGWYHFEPDLLPPRFDSDATELMVLVTTERRPARIVLSKPENDCDGLMAWLSGSLSRKYGAGEDAEAEPGPGQAQAVRFFRGDRQIDASCGPDGLLLQYTDTRAYGHWQSERFAALAAYRKEQEALARAAAEVEARELRAAADSFTFGDGMRLEGALGVRFEDAFEGLESFTPDEASDVELAELPEPLAAGRYQITLSPGAEPIRIAGWFPDPDGSAFERLSSAVEAKFGAPMKHTDTHRIYRINGDFIVFRRLERLGQGTISVIDSSAQQAQREREALAARRQFEEETAGL